MWRKVLISGALLTGLLVGSAGIVSADVITDVNGVSIEKPTPVAPVVDKVVSDLTPDDYKVDVVPNQGAATNAVTEGNDNQSVVGVRMPGGVPTPFIGAVTLTDAGKAKVEAAIGHDVSDADMRVVAAIHGQGLPALPGVPGVQPSSASSDANSDATDDKSDDMTYGDVVGLLLNKAPQVDSVAVVVADHDKPTTVSNTDDVKKLIATAQSEQSKYEQAHPVSDTAKMLIDKSHTVVQSGVDMPNGATAPDQVSNTSRTASGTAPAESKTSNVLWETLGYVIVAIAGLLVGGGAYWVRKRKK